MMVASVLVRWRLAFEAVAAFILVGGLKVLVHALGFEYLEINSLFSSVIGGAVFVFGLILAGTLADYKESERIPAEIAAVCGSIIEDGRYCAEQFPAFDLATLRGRVLALLEAFRADLADSSSRAALAALSDLTSSLLEMERIGVPANHVVRLKGEQAAIRRTLMRVYYIQRIEFLPSARNFVTSLVVLILALLLVTVIEPVYLGIALVGFLAYLFVYILRLLALLDTPFRVREKTQDDVSLFLLHEAERDLGK
jgi:hypothetical protein